MENLIGTSKSTLSQWRQIKRAEKEPLAFVLHGLANKKSNAAKGEDLCKLFVTFINRIRSPSGRSKGRHLFRLPSYIKRIAPTVPKSSMIYLRKLHQSLYQEFESMLSILYDHGNNNNNNIFILMS